MSCLPPNPDSTLVEASCKALHLLVTGTFNTVALYLLAFDPLARSLSIHRRVAAQGPHQYLCTNAIRDRLYATTWASPSTLSAWKYNGDTLDLVNTASISPQTATGSYVSFYQDRIYSAGGPTGEVHALDAQTGGFSTKLQEMTYVDDVESADKSRKALRYGAHSADVSAKGGRAYVAHLGRNSIFMYDVRRNGELDLVAEVPSARKGDAPRHCLPSQDGRFLYSVTEHTSFIDAYAVEKETLRHIQTVSIIPDHLDRHDYRGDTLRFGTRQHSDGRIPLIASTRGKTYHDRGYVAIWKVDPESGLLLPSGDDASGQPARYETPNSGGKGNAIEPAFWAESDQEIVILTDDQDGFISILEYNGTSIELVDSIRLPGKADDGTQEGASHAIWLS